MFTLSNLLWKIILFTSSQFQVLSNSNSEQFLTEIATVFTSTFRNAKVFVKKNHFVGISSNRQENVEGKLKQLLFLKVIKEFYSSFYELQMSFTSLNVKIFLHSNINSRINLENCLEFVTISSKISHNRTFYIEKLPK